MAVYMVATKGRGVRLAPRKTRKLSRAELNAWNAARRARELAEVRRTETVTLDVEVHLACGGQIQYTSFYRDEGQNSALVGGGHYPDLKEQRSCFCKTCGAGINDPDRLARYAELMTAHRNRETE